MPSLPQDVLDYGNDAQMRVCADTRILRKRATLSIIAGTQEYRLPADVIQILAVNDGATPITAITTDDALNLLSAAGAVSTAMGTQVYYTLNTGTIGFIPVPTVAVDLQISYEARPAPLESDDDFEVTGSFENLIEHLTQSSILEDDAQYELAIAEFLFYQSEVKKLQRLRVKEQRQRLAPMGYRVGQL